MKLRSPSRTPQQKRETGARFGGRATAGGVTYEAQVAAFLGVKMLAGEHVAVWEGISGADIKSITLQAAEAVDDIVVELKTSGARAYVSAKDRNSTIPLTERSQAFVDVVKAFVTQSLHIGTDKLGENRLIWVASSSAGRVVTRDLLRVMDTFRQEAEDISISTFLRGRQSGERDALAAFVSLARKIWKNQARRVPSENELKILCHHVYIEVHDFESNHRGERACETDIRTYVAAQPKDASKIWSGFEHFFLKADSRGLRVTPTTLRRSLLSNDYELKSAPDYAKDIDFLQKLSARNLARLKEHTLLRFGPKPSDSIHIRRPDELVALTQGATAGHLLLTGDPGCGKSGLIHSFVESLQEEGAPVILLLAEETLDPADHRAEYLTGTSHPLVDILLNWPSRKPGFLVTDALDAVRDVDTQKRLRKLLCAVGESESQWVVVASVREFDLKHGRELREAFPGQGVPGYKSSDFHGVAHFFLSGLTSDQLDELGSQHKKIQPFIESARTNPKSNDLQRSPFYLKLAAELLKDGIHPARLADWNSPAMLLRKFWEERVERGDGTDSRQAILATIALQMTRCRHMVISTKEIALSESDRSVLRELRLRGILQGPVRRYGAKVNDEEIRFGHHLLHDYAISRSIIPSTKDGFCNFAIQNPLLPVLYRQSFMFALEDLWDNDLSREDYWASAIRLEGVSSLHGITRTLAPILAARRIEEKSDLQPLLDKIVRNPDSESSASKALRHLASGVQDANAPLIQAGARGWTQFSVSLSELLPRLSHIEPPLVHILSQLNKAEIGSDSERASGLNQAARSVLARHVQKDVNGGWRYAARVSIEAICRTYNRGLW